MVSQGPFLASLSLIQKRIFRFPMATSMRLPQGYFPWLSQGYTRDSEPLCSAPVRSRAHLSDSLFLVPCSPVSTGRHPFPWSLQPKRKHRDYQVLLPEKQSWWRHHPKLCFPWTLSAVISKTFSMLKPCISPCTLIYATSMQDFLNFRSSLSSLGCHLTL